MNMAMMFGVVQDSSTPVDEAVVRSTATPVVVDAPAAMQDAPPEFNEPLESDQNPNLGIVNRTLASHWVEGTQSRPFWQAAVDQNYEHNEIVDRQVSSSGTAAAREAQGEWGHGTASYAIGIEPQGDLVDGGKLTNTYFSAGKPDIQHTSGDYMMPPPGYDAGATAMAAAGGKAAARDAAASPYDVWWKGGA